MFVNIYPGSSRAGDEEVSGLGSASVDGEVVRPGRTTRTRCPGIAFTHVNVGGDATSAFLPPTGALGWADIDIRRALVEALVAREVCSQGGVSGVEQIGDVRIITDILAVIWERVFEM